MSLPAVACCWLDSFDAAWLTAVLVVQVLPSLQHMIEAAQKLRANGST